MFTSKPGPSVVSELDGGCTWANGAFSKQCLAWPPDKGFTSQADFIALPFIPSQRVGGERMQ